MVENDLRNQVHTQRSLVEYVQRNMKRRMHLGVQSCGYTRPNGIWLITTCEGIFIYTYIYMYTKIHTYHIYKYIYIHIYGEHSGIDTLKIYNYNSGGQQYWFDDFTSLDPKVSVAKLVTTLFPQLQANHPQPFEPWPKPIGWLNCKCLG